MTDETLPTLWKWLRAPSLEEQCTYCMHEYYRHAGMLSAEMLHLFLHSFRIHTAMLTSSMYSRRHDLARVLKLYTSEHGPSFPYSIG